MGERKLFIVCRNVDRENVLRKNLAEAGSANLVGVFRTAESAGDFEALLSAARPEALLVDSSVDPDLALDFAGRARERVVRLAVMLIMAAKDFDLLQRAIEAGVESVQTEPVDFRELLVRLEAAVQEKVRGLELLEAARSGGGIGTALTDRIKSGGGAEASAPPPPPRAGAGHGTVLAFLSGKDGEGKSTVGLNLGLALANRYGKKVIYLDLTETLSETAMLLNQKPPGDIRNILAMRSTGDFTPYGVKRFAIDYFEDESFLAICGNPSIEPPRVDRDALDLLLRFLKTQAEFVLLECPPRFGDILKTALKLADWHVVVVQNTLSSLRNARVFLAELKRLEYPAHQVRIVLNRVSKTAGLARDDLARNLDPYPIVTSIVSNGPIAIEAVTVGMPVVLHAPESDIAESIQNFAKKLLGIETSDVDSNQKFSLGSMITSFLGKD